MHASRKLDAAGLWAIAMTKMLNPWLALGTCLPLYGRTKSSARRSVAPMIKSLERLEISSSILRIIAITRLWLRSEPVNELFYHIDINSNVCNGETPILFAVKMGKEA